MHYDDPRADHGYKCHQLQATKRRIWLWIIFNCICNRSLFWKWPINENLHPEKYEKSFALMFGRKPNVPFSIRRKEYAEKGDKSFKIPLFCICRLPDNREEKMGKCEECKEWFHKSCLSIPKKVFEEVNSKWYCTKCKKKMTTQIYPPQIDFWCSFDDLFLLFWQSYISSMNHFLFSLEKL